MIDFVIPLSRHVWLGWKDEAGLNIHKSQVFIVDFRNLTHFPECFLHFVIYRFISDSVGSMIKENITGGVISAYFTLMSLHCTF